MAVPPQGAKTLTRLGGMPNDPLELKRRLVRVARDGEIRACSEASGAGYVLHRALQEWGTSTTSSRRRSSRSGRACSGSMTAGLARLNRAGELVAVRIPSEADERVCDVVRCRETFQSELLNSRHYILTFLARRGFVFREGTNWCTPHSSGRNT